MDITGKLAQANGRLKAHRVGVRIEQMGEKLYLQATLPPKPGSSKPQPHQQRIALGIGAHPRGVQMAEQEARKIGALKDCGEFDWSQYLKTGETSSDLTGDWLAKFEAEVKPTVNATTWRTEYKQVFSRLPQEQLLTRELLLEAIAKVPNNTRNRKRYCTSLSRLAEFAGIELNVKPLKGNYSYTEVDPRTLPTDQQVAEWFHRIPNSRWQYVYGLLATFGLRNHEAFFLDVEPLKQGKYWIEVQSSKSCKHLVWAFYPEWVELFGLRDGQLPPGESGSHEAYGHRVTTQFSRYEVPFSPYDLRHRWAVRTLEFGLPDSHAAKQMGHSVTVHERIYHHWITAETHQRAFDVLMLRGDRPRPPEV
ncbi:site-specific integrase [Oculatella sp. LEGE 06141]|uniref:site-specific integrase n=1 Tax=Oculatella sp. LEGE 06141 TaxID=1828648 RepID=UPI0018804F58|nr:site-specific integrase [Oculatella sp. LEGE 06141]MBE9179129.1 site-specific integrase [Oculatella sp. LEGE 06141]